MKFLIIPCVGTPAGDYAKIYDALKFASEQDYARHVRRTITWCEADSSNPYVEIKIPKENDDEEGHSDNSSRSNLD